MTNTVLLVEDDVVLRRAITQSISLENINVLVANSYAIAEEHITKNFDGIVLTDIRMEGKDGFDVLNYAQSCDIELPVIMLTGHGDIAMAVRAVQKGAFDFLEKPCHPDHLLRVIRKALNQRRQIMRVRELEQKNFHDNPIEMDFPGTSSAIHFFRGELLKLARLPVNVHFWGESGSGRVSAAKCLCRIRDSEERIIEKSLVDCDVNYFDAIQNENEPKFRIFKNIELAAREQQEKLCEFIDNNSNHRVVTLSIAALDVIPEEQLSKDLYYRLSTAQLEVPALRSRQEDILPIFHTMLQQQADAMQLSKPEIPAEKLANLSTQDWSGNIAELRQYAQKVLLDLDKAGTESQKQSLTNRMKTHEKSILEDALRRHSGHTARVAEELSIPVKTLYDRLSRHGLKSSKYR